jgi:hypothetical protein
LSGLLYNQEKLVDQFLWRIALYRGAPQRPWSALVLKKSR